MPRSRRDFLAFSSLGLVGTALPAHAAASPAEPAAPSQPEVTAASLAEAEKLLAVTLTPAERALAATAWDKQMLPHYERRIGPRKLALEPELAPATLWNPLLPGLAPPSSASSFQPSTAQAPPLPAEEASIAFAPVTHLSRWIESRALTSERLTGIYLDRLERHNPQLRCVITLTREHAIRQARQADSEIAAGKYRGPLHGIPYGVKDLLDTAGIATTWGAEPFRNRIPAADSAVVRKLNEAGAVLVAKLSLGALAMNDIWFGGQTMNPWLPEEGASGSSAGPASAVSAGLVAFAIGSETEGSIVSPSMRCGVTGLRPTFGRVPRTGAMTLSWTMDKLGPMTRSVEDAITVLNAIHGLDSGDPYGISAPLSFNAAADVKGLRLGYFPKWLQEDPATTVDRAALETAKKLGFQPVEVHLPDWPYNSLFTILDAEAAAAMEEITLDHRIDQLKMQTADAWPNSFRRSRFLSAVDLVQADRMRRKVAFEMARIFGEVDLLLVPSLRDEMLNIANFTGHPSLTFRAGFIEVTEARSDWAPDPAHPLPKFSTPRRVPHGVTLIGRLCDEGRLAEAGLALERSFAVAAERPNGF